ncbi:hypothetical protein L1987_50223 [Smallanthus sonchifolius]|uniref:Uncharacterized protein n=1 Tax=Smallanthus sonchifolius TaxID=185202 RepID=A0ACB9FXF8_9ASTR|nr:hypothetical protein L1987_50223 [Smallanthus sonchifolius]
MDTSFMEHVNKEKPFESRFFEPPESGDVELLEEETNDITNTTPCDGKEDTTPRLSQGLTRLIEEQGVNRYKLRSDDDSGKGAIRHHATKSKILKPDRGRRKKQSEPGDKENRPINMPSTPEEEPLSGYAVGDVNIADRSNDGDIMQNSLHGDVPEPSDPSETHPCMQVSNGDEELHPGRHTSVGMTMNEKITLNMEDPGDSILNNMLTQTVCDEVLVEGEEQEVSSDQNTKYQNSIHMDYPKVDIGGERNSVEEWARIVNRNNECLEKENYLGIEETRKRIQSAWSQDIEGVTTTFCYNNNLTTMGLKNWLGSHTSMGRVGKRKMRNHTGQKQLLIETGEEDYDLQVGTAGMRKKKKNTMSRQEMQEPQNQGDIKERINSKDTHAEGIARKFWRIWSSRNRKPEKNMSKNTYQFRQDFIPTMITHDPILIKEFNLGKGKEKEVHVPAQGKLSFRNNTALRKLQEKEARLLEIAKNINTTSANSKLINSITGLARSRITRNVMLGGKPMDIPESSRANERTNPSIDNQKQTEEHGGQGMYKPSGTIGNNSVKDTQRKGTRNVTVTETSNRFMLLDEEGNELESGFRWASYVREEESEFDDSNAAVHSQNGDEVDSETDATASFMKDDHSYRNSAPSDGVTVVDGVEQVQMDFDIVQAENIGSKINGS